MKYQIIDIKSGIEVYSKFIQTSLSMLPNLDKDKAIKKIEIILDFNNELKQLQEILDCVIYAYKLGKENIQNEDSKLLDELLKEKEDNGNKN